LGSKEEFLKRLSHAGSVAVKVLPEKLALIFRSISAVVQTASESSFLFFPLRDGIGVRLLDHLDLMLPVAEKAVSVA
jgi:hypothetical protein